MNDIQIPVLWCRRILVLSLHDHLFCFQAEIWISFAVYSIPRLPSYLFLSVLMTVYKNHGLLGCDVLQLNWWVWTFQRNTLLPSAGLSTVNMKAADCSEMVIPSTKPYDIFQKSIIFSAPFMTEILYALLSPANTVMPPISFPLTYHFSNVCWKLWLSGSSLQFCPFIDLFVCLIIRLSIMFLIIFSLLFSL